MHITYEAVIAKMESELKKAKESKNHEQMRGHLFAIKALAELTLETGEEIRIEQPQFIEVSDHNEPVLSKLSPSKEKYIDDLDDGGSILDF